VAPFAARALAAALGLRHFCGGKSDCIGGIGGTLRSELSILYDVPRELKSLREDRPGTWRKARRRDIVGASPREV
jgi:hypothetical protein